MARQILMPTLSPTMEEGTLAKWLVVEGQSVCVGDVLAEIETDKATLDFEATEDGTIGQLLVAEGARAVPVDTPIAVLLEPGAAVPAGLGQATSTSAVARSGRPEGRRPTGDWPPGTRTKRQTVREALHDAIAEEMRRDESVFLMGEDVGQSEGTYRISHGLLDEFKSRRVVDTPTTEHGFAGLAIGAAFAGLRPIVEFMTFNFGMQALDQIINSAAKVHYMSGGEISAPVVFRGPNGASARVGAQHSQDFAAWFAHVPGLKVVMPYSASDAKGLLKSAIRDPGPVIFLENEVLYGQSFEVPVLEDFTIPLGKGFVCREGEDVTLVSFGIGMRAALEAAQELEKDGISAEVIDLRSLRPLDTETVVASVQKTHRCVTVEDGWPVGSIGSHLSAVLMQEAFDDLDAPVVTLTGKDVPMPYAADLEAHARVQVADVLAAVRRVTYA